MTADDVTDAMLRAGWGDPLERFDLPKMRAAMEADK